VKHLCVAPIIEGHGEVDAVRVLLPRVASELVGVTLEVVRPFRLPRGKLLPGRSGARRIDEQELARALDTASTLLKHANSQAQRFALLLCDADEDLPCDLAPRILAGGRKVRGDLDLACVMARREYEAWFIAAAESLTRYLSLRPGDEAASAEPELHGEKWIADRFRGVSYQKTVDQAKLTAAMDLGLCRDRSRSFAKLCREISSRS
jgi:hypothetical protein